MLMQPTTSNTQAHTPEDLYHKLFAFFQDHATQVLELDITPSISAPIQDETAALAIRPKDLAKVYLVAHQRFFRPDDISSVLSSPIVTTDGAARFNETPILLFFAPEHLVASNTRKLYLNSRIRSQALDREEYDAAVSLLRKELSLLDSFVRSPLPKHTKSPNLWSHRFWVIQTFVSMHILVSAGERPEARQRQGTNDELDKSCGDWPPTLENELEVVLNAGDRHFANYVAFDYARRIYKVVEMATDYETITKTVMRWCFAHPRDISGWAFLDFVLQQESLSTSFVDEVRDMTKQFAQQTGSWNSSMEWFTKVRGWHITPASPSSR